MSSLWGAALPPEQTKPAKTNPCILLYGPGPERKQCKTCTHCRITPMTQGTYHKCDLRTLTRGSATDHRTRWPACGKYEEAQP